VIFLNKWRILEPTPVFLVQLFKPTQAFARKAFALERATGELLQKTT